MSGSRNLARCYVREYREFVIGLSVKSFLCVLANPCGSLLWCVVCSAQCNFNSGRWALAWFLVCGLVSLLDQVPNRLALYSRVQDNGCICSFF